LRALIRQFVYSFSAATFATKSATSGERREKIDAW
jgi:hypothetical protein